MDEPARIVASVYRAESGRVVSRLVRAFGGDFDLAEDVFQEAIEAALVQWRTEGVPDNPRAWLVRAARNKAVDRIRRRVRLDEKLEEQGPFEEVFESEDPADGFPDLGDDQLRLIFTCCHPALAFEAQVALTLRTLSGLTTDEIARAFMVEETAMAQRLVRAKQKIRLAKIPYRVPPPEELGERVEAVLSVVYLVFNEGYAATAGDALIRYDLAKEAIRVGRLLAKLLPARPAVKALLALMLLHDARREARLGSDGDIIVLEEQDRALWDREAIDEGLRLLDEALDERGRGPYVIQAAIAALHARAARPEDTDWAQIEELYRALLTIHPSPVIELNHAAALAMARGPDEGLLALDRMADHEALRGYHLLPAARADLLRRKGALTEAEAAYRQALGLVTNEAERRYLLRRIEEVTRGR